MKNPEREKKTTTCREDHDGVGNSQKEGNEMELKRPQRKGKIEKESERERPYGGKPRQDHRSGPPKITFLKGKN